MKEIVWFPGHMARTRRLISDSIKKVDCVVELIDARAPYSSQNPEIAGIIGQKPHVLVLNKADLANPLINRQWLSYYRDKGIVTEAFNSLKSRGLREIKSAVFTSVGDKLRQRAKRGITSGAIRLLVVGVPNVGKSSFINRLSGRAGAKTGNRPGITTGKQWISGAGGFELLDVPGVLWPKFDDPRAGLFLAFMGSIKDEILDTTALAQKLFEHIKAEHEKGIFEAYKISGAPALSGEELLTQAARRRGFLLPGGELDLERAAITVLTEFRAGRIGAISLESPADYE